MMIDDGKNDQTGQMPGRYRGVGPRGYRRSDERILEEVNDRLTDDPAIDATDIAVAVAQGEVTLSGTVDHRAARRHAEDVTERVSGVTHVQNDLRVGAGMGSVTGPGAPARAGVVAGLDATSMVLGKIPVPEDAVLGNNRPDHATSQD